MFVINLMLMAGLGYAGWRSYNKRHNRKLIDQLVETPQLPFIPLDNISLLKNQQSARSDYQAATLSLVLSLGGFFIYGPLGLWSVPLSLYSALTPFEEGFDALAERQWLRLPVLVSAASIQLILTQNYFLTSFVQWFYAINRLAILRLFYSLQTMTEEDKNRIAQIAAMWLAWETQFVAQQQATRQQQQQAATNRTPTIILDRDHIRDANATNPHEET